MRFCTAFIFIFIFWQYSFAIKSLTDFTVPYFERVEPEAEEISGAITALAQDDKGFVWIGTQHGLVRYDGYNIKKYANDSNDINSLSGNFITTIWPAQNGKIWVGTRSNGASVFNPETDDFVQYKHDENNPQSIANNRVSAIVDDAEYVWLGTNDGLDRLDKASGQITHFKHSEENANSINDNHIRSLLIDHENNLWVGSYDGLNLKKSNSDNFTNYMSVAGGEDSLAGHVIFRIFQAEDQAIWVATPRRGAIRIDLNTQGLIRMHPEAAPSRKIPYQWVTAITQPDTNTIWLGTNSEGIAAVNSSTGEVKRIIQKEESLPSSLGHDDIGSLMVDKSGLVWVGTWGAGLNLFNATNPAIQTLKSIPMNKNSLSDSHVLSLLELANGQIWFGTKSNGIDIFDPTAGFLSGHRYAEGETGALAESSIHALAQTSDGNVWVGTIQSGLQMVHPEGKEFKTYTESDGLISVQIRHLLATNNNQLWVGTYAGLNKLDSETGEFQTFYHDDSKSEVFKETVLSLAEVSNGNLAIGTNSGLFFIESGSEVVKQVNQLNSTNLPSGKEVKGLLSANDQLWLATTQGIDYLPEWNLPFDFEHLNQNLGQPSQDLGSNLFVDNSNRIWSERWLLHPEQNSMRRWSTAEGFDIGTPWDGSKYQFRNGHMAFGGTKGVLIVDPEQYVEWRYEPPLVFSSIKLDGQEIIHAGSEPLVIAAHNRSLTVEFSALDYSDPSQIQYAYQLVGYDPDWIQTTETNRFATYTNLDPGEYQLRIKGTNRIGDWSPNQNVLLVIKEAAWYQTYLFYLLVLFALILLVFLLFKYRFRQLRKSEMLLQQRVDQQTKQLNQQNEKLAMALSQVRDASYTDALTKLKNRRYFKEHIDDFISKVDTHETVYFLLIDIDHFKKCNDTYGHAAGDSVLEQFADVLRSTLSPSDMIVRWGGEEFMVVGKVTTATEIFKVAERIRSSVENHAFTLNANTTINQTCSIGMAPYPFLTHAQSLSEIEVTTAAADSALYYAKRHQRNAWACISYTGSEADSVNINQLLDQQNISSDDKLKIVSSIDEA